MWKWAGPSNGGCSPTVRHRNFGDRPSRLASTLGAACANEARRLAEETFVQRLKLATAEGERRAEAAVRSQAEVDKQKADAEITALETNLSELTAQLAAADRDRDEFVRAAAAAAEADAAAQVDVMRRQLVEQASAHRTSSDNLRALRWGWRSRGAGSEDDDGYRDQVPRRVASVLDEVRAMAWLVIASGMLGNSQHGR